nr:hypothetical protein GCM10010200_003690 [Actinomadura rugatobispora]
MQDVHELEAVLADQAIGGFSVRVLRNDPAHLVMEAIEDHFADAEPDDVLLLYFSCHGYKDEAGRFYFATTGTRLARPNSTAVPAAYVSDQLRHSRSRNIVLLLDCCHSGAFTRGMVARSGGNVDVAERLRGSGCAVLCSSTSLEYSFEVDHGRVSAGRPTAGGPRPSVFTSAVIQGLRTGEADLNGDGRVTIDELYEYAYGRIRETTSNQTPTKFVDVRGELVVASSPRGARPRPIPEEVLSAAGSLLTGSRLEAVNALWRLARDGLPAGATALERLVAMQHDDSRQVSARAREAVEDVRRHATWPPLPQPPVPRPPVPQPFVPPQRAPLPPHRAGPVLPPVGTAPHPAAREGLGPAAAAYFLPFFLGLVLVRARTGLARFHAWQCVAIDVLTVLYTVVGTMVGVGYGLVRYGNEPMPENDIVLNVFTAGFLLLPIVLRGYCLVALAMGRPARIAVLAPVAARLAGRRSRRTA